MGSSVAGSKSNIIPDRAVLLVNLRTYDRDVRRRMIDAVERMVRAECEASGSPRPPEFEYFDQYPLTDNDADVTEKVTAAFRSHFGSETVFDLGRLTASEDFSDIPDAFVGPMAQLLCAIEDDTSPEISGDDNLKTMALVEACYRSVAEHRAIELVEFPV